MKKILKRSHVAMAAGAAIAASACFPAAAQVQLQLSDIAAGIGGFAIDGRAAEARAGEHVSQAGDVNGDGLDDLVIAPADGVQRGNGSTGVAYVVFGRGGGARVALSDVAAGAGGFGILGEEIPGSVFSVFSVRSAGAAGDVNGDGLADLIVSADVDRRRSEPGNGRAYVIYGKTDTATVQLSDVALGHGGFVIVGLSDQQGPFAVAAAGDVNGDGLADLIVGDGGAGTKSKRSAGASHVIFGKTDGMPVGLADVSAGNGGFVIIGADEEDASGTSVAGAGDVNGDGLADLAIGAPSSRYGGTGEAYIVFGKRDARPVKLKDVDIGIGGIHITGTTTYDHAGSTVAGAGDVDGDGLADVLITSPTDENPYGVARSEGHAYVVFGKTDTTAVSLRDVEAGAAGFSIVGEREFEPCCVGAARAGDVNGDGLSDVILGGEEAGEDDRGRVFVVFGKPGRQPVELARVAQRIRGFVMNGEQRLSLTGRSVAGAGDLNGDGLADMIVGAPSFDGAAGRDSGRIYVIFGATTGVFADSKVDQFGTDGADELTGSREGDAIVAGAGDDKLVGKGNADVLYGGSGDDTFVLNARNVQALSTGGSRRAGLLARVDGGSGIDTLALRGAGITLDLTAIPKVRGGASRIESIERIDITGEGDNRLQLSAGDVHDIAGMNIVNAGTQGALGWSNGSYVFPAVVERHQLVVEGDAGDVLVSERRRWTRAGTAFRNGRQYVVLDSVEGRAQVLVDGAITRKNLPR